ncbi:MAG: hypothetical protein K0S68_317 [Candidatus Saccharibacteria bacterium]|jgi:NDP-sugar pyrophosphorylase family protein|nr:hypothetical protein [Candidatus Saccharibacteria bacterium]
MHDATVYINAGGRGTRLNGVFQPDPRFGIAKALLRIGPNGKTAIECQVESALATQPRNVVVAAGDQSEVVRHIEAAYGTLDNVTVLHSDQCLGNGGDLIWSVRRHLELFAPELVVVNCDTLLTLRMQDLVTTHRSHPGVLTMGLTTLPGVPNEKAFWVNPDGLILYNGELQRNAMTEAEAGVFTQYRASSSGALAVDTGFVADFDWDSQRGELSIYRDIVGQAVRSRRAYAYNNGRNLFLDIGTAATWAQVAQDPSLVNTMLRYA